MARRDLIVVGGSAGAHAALLEILARLPVDLPAAVLVATHLAPGPRSALADMLAKESALPIVAAVDGEPVRLGQVHVAVPDRHLLIGAGGVLRLGAGPRENRVRPAVNPLFRAAARWAGSRVAAVVLSGSLDDGASAVAAPAAELARLLAQCAGEPVEDVGAPDVSLVWETDMAADGRTDVKFTRRPVALGCPECRGGMYEVRTGRAVHYVCHVGHSWSPRSFVAASDDAIETALWTAISVMQEKIAMLGELATQAERAGDRDRHRSYRAEAERVGRDAEVLRRRMLRVDASPA